MSPDGSARLRQRLPRLGSRRGKPELQRSDIQGNILNGYKQLPDCAYLFFSVKDPELARIWLGEMADVIQNAERPKGEVAVNLGITYAGLQALGAPAVKLATLPEAFREGMAARAAGLGDETTEVDGRAVPVGWHAPFGPDGDLHLLVMVSGRPDDVDEYIAALRKDTWDSGLIEEEGMIRGSRPPDGKEHFGFVDGVSNPRVVLTKHKRGSRPMPAVAAGEFILGMPNEDGVVLDGAPSLTRNGSYLVLRKLEQDADGFDEMIAAGAAQTRLDPQLLRAKLMGRWPGGAPLTSYPDAEPADDCWKNDKRFDYSTDDGAGCPVGAHVRRANPRGGLEFDGRLENRHQIMRRGIPYGDRWAPRTADGTGYGLVFACYQASIAGQFEFVQSEWLGDGNVFALSTDTDLVADTSVARRLRIEGQRRAGSSPARPPLFMEAMERCVTSRGGEYFLVPGIEAIRNIAALNELYAHHHPTSA